MPAFARSTVTTLQIVDADRKPGALDDTIRAVEFPPGFVHRDDEPLRVEQSDVRGQRIDNGGLLGELALTQALLGADEQEWPTVEARHRIHLASRQFL